MKTGKIPKIERVYDSFREFDRGRSSSRIDLVADAFVHSKNWAALAFGRAKNPDLRSAVADLNQLKIDVAYPFLIAVMQDRDEGAIDDSELVEIVRLLESYVFRRAITGIPTNILNKLFSTLATEIDKAHYVESLKAALLLKESYAKMPTDEEFKAALLVKDVYNFRNRNYFLRKLENFDHKEPFVFDDWTVEHIMPQNPDVPLEWRNELGSDWKAVHERWLHTIGNLTLTGYNPELSDRPFSEKLTMKGGFQDSHLRLNHYLAGLGRWNDQDIQKRAELLADWALKIWPTPELAEDILARYRKAKPGATISLENYPHLVGSMRELFDELHRRILNLGPGVSEVARKKYIGYSFASNFVEIVPQANELKLFLDIPLDKLSDPLGLGRDVSGVGHWGTGEVEVGLSAPDQIEGVMSLVRQSFETQNGE